MGCRHWHRVIACHFRVVVGEVFFLPCGVERGRDCSVSNGAYPHAHRVTGCQGGRGVCRSGSATSRR